MTKSKQTIGDPLEDVISTGKIGGSRQIANSSEVQTSNSSDFQNAISKHELKQSESLTVQKSKSLTTQTSKEKRTQQTIYLPPDLAKWLRIRAIEEGREISEVASDAFETYKRLHP